MVNRGVRFDATQSDVSEQSAMSEKRKFAVVLITDKDITYISVS